MEGNRSLPAGLRAFPIILLLPLLLLAAGCTGTRESEGTREEPGKREAFLARYESSFSPSQYDPDVDSVISEFRRRSSAMESVSVAVIAPPETTQGYRIQILITGDIENANNVRDSAARFLPDEWIYTIYDAPYYKVRVGNFLGKLEANPILKKLISLGYSDAWIVPDHVIKNPPPKVPESFIVPERFQEQHR